MLENALFLGLMIGACFGLGVAVLFLRLRARDTRDLEAEPDPMGHGLSGYALWK